MTRTLFLRACLLSGLLLGVVATGWANSSPEVGDAPAVADDDPPDPASLRLQPEIEILGTVQTLTDDDLDLTYGLLGGGGLGFSVRSGRDTRFVVRIEYLRSEGDPYYDQSAFDAGTPAELVVVPFSLGVRHDLAPHAALRLNVGFALGLDWIREELPDPQDPANLATYDGVGWGLDFSLGPEYRTRDERYGIGLEIAYGRHEAEVSNSQAGDHELNRSGLFGRVYLVFALGASGHDEEVAP